MKRFGHGRTLPALIFIGLLMMTVGGCVRPPLIGMVYTRVRLPLTTDLYKTHLPEHGPSHHKIIEIREPVTGVGFYARVDSNAIGDIAKTHGISTLHFADQEIFSILGFYNTVQVLLYGEE